MERMEPTSPGPLAQIDDWGAPFAAAAATGPAGVLATHGDPTAVVRVASITKLITSLAVLLAVEEGSTSLDEPLGPPGSTVRHLLCHAGGYDFDTPRVLATPGDRRIYSNTGYDLLGEHVAERTGIAFADYLAEGVLQPLGMASAELRGSPAKDLHSSLGDLIALAGELLSPTLLAPETMQAYVAPQFPELAGVLPGWGRQDPCPWGLGPELRGTKVPHWSGSTAPPGTYGHFGGSGTFLWVDPERRIACIVLTDREFGAWSVELWPDFSDRVRAYFAA
jgi:CubicO group peptidase (beta-lactamase class C family)